MLSGQEPQICGFQALQRDKTHGVSMPYLANYKEGNIVSMLPIRCNYWGTAEKPPYLVRNSTTASPRNSNLSL